MTHILRISVFILSVCMFFSSVVALTPVNIEEYSIINALGEMESRISFFLTDKEYQYVDLTSFLENCNNAAFTYCNVIKRFDNSVVVHVKRNIDMNIIDAYFLSNDYVRFHLQHNYTPVHNIVGSHVLQRDITLLIEFPSHTIQIDNFRSKSALLNFTLDISTEEKKIGTKSDNATTGTYVNMWAFAADKCFLFMEQTNSSRVLSKTLTCDTQTLRIPDNIASGDYIITIVGLTNKNALFGKKKINIEYKKRSANVFIDETDHLGENIVLFLESDQNISSCDLSIYDDTYSERNTAFYSNCKERLTFPTLTEWEDGNYHLQLNYFINDSVEIVTKDFTLVAASNLVAEEIILEKKAFSPGETLSALVEFEGEVDFCETRLFDSKNTLLLSSESFACEKTQLILDESLPPGKYTIRTDIYKDGQIISKRRNHFTLNTWNPLPGTEMERYCPYGTFLFLEQRLPCIQSGHQCIPTSQTTPLCMCFSQDETLLDMCHFGESCKNSGCIKNVTLPFHIHFEGEKCIASKGDYVLDCIELGQLCMASNCVCIHNNNLFSCEPGDICTPNGCFSPILMYELRSFTPTTMRQNDVQFGIDFKWNGVLRLENKPITPNNISAEAKLGPLDAKQITTKLEEDGTVTFITYFSGKIDPGHYEIYLVIEKDGETFITRRKVHIWYNDNTLKTKVKDILPVKIENKLLKNGLPFRVRLNIYDKTGKEMKNLDSSSFSISFKDIKTESISAEYVDRMWSIVGVLQANNVKEKTRTLNFSINHLGRYTEYKQPVEFLEKIPLQIQILKLFPGNQNDPIFHMLTTMGFDLEIILRIQGYADINKDVFSIFINGINYTDHISHLVQTNIGPKMRITNIRMCPNPPSPHSLIPVEIFAATDSQTTFDSAFLYIDQNPGSWTNLVETQCEETII